MAVAFRAVSAAVNVARGNIVLNLPTREPGDVLVACIGYRSTAPFTPPAGWTEIPTEQSSGNTSTTASSGIGSAFMAYHVFNGEDPSTTFTRTAGDVAMGSIVSLSGVDNASPLDVSVGATQASAGTSLSTAGVTTTVANAFLVKVIGGGADITFSTHAATDPVAANWTERQDGLTTTGADTTLCIATATKATAGATGNLTAAGSVSTRSAVMCAAFKPGNMAVNIAGARGGMALGGNPSMSLGYSRDGSGGMALGGVGDYFKSYAREGSGGMVLSGNAAVLKDLHLFGSGGMAFGGSPPYSDYHVPAPGKTDSERPYATLPYGQREFGADTVEMIDALLRNDVAAYDIVYLVELNPYVEN